MADQDNEYDVFISYAHYDNTELQLLPPLVETLSTTYRRITGHTLRVFIDSQKIDTAQMWERRIQSALAHSASLVALLSPSYFTSEWCGREWSYFAQMEQRTRDALNLPPDMGLIFPVKIADWSRVFRLPKERQEQILDAGQRQQISLENLKPDDPIFHERVAALAEDIIDVLRQLDRAQTTTAAAPTDMGQAMDAAASAAPGEARSLVARVGTDREMFIRRLAEAIRVTVIGITNQHLCKYLEAALKQKRQQQGEDAFWLQLSIVFPSEGILNTMCDELADALPDAAKADDKRIKDAGLAKRALSHFLVRQNKPRNWKLYEYSHALPFIGALFEMPNGEHIAQVATLRPAFSSDEYLFFEFATPHDAAVVAYYQAAFEEIIQRSKHHAEIIVIGRPQYPLDSHQIGFISHHARFRRSVLEAGAQRDDWIAAVIVILWFEENGECIPLFQVRTSENATRELDMLSSVSGYINQQDCREFDSGVAREFVLQPSAPENAIARELREELGLKDDDWQDCRLEREIRFYYPHLENFYFYLYTARVTTALNHVTPAAYLQPWRFPQIMQVREYQVIAKMLEYLNIDAPRRGILQTARSVLSDNLILHRRPELAARLLAVGADETGVDGLRQEARALLERLATPYNFYGERRTIQGLAGLQYREFFSSLVPAFAGLGVAGADETLHWLETDTDARGALERLKRHYSSEVSIQDAELDV